MSIPCDSEAVYLRPPLYVKGGIPVFSRVDRYIRNYNRISRVHLREVRKSGDNPFMHEVWWHELEQSTLRHILSHSQENSRILDIGVGLGRLLENCTGLQRYGTDISWGYLKEARNKGIAVCLANAEALPYRTAMFDLVVCTDVLEHVIDLNAVCAQIVRVLRPGGKLILRVPYRENLAPYLSPAYPFYFAHLRAFDEFGIRLLFERVHHCRLVATESLYNCHRPNLLRFPCPVIMSIGMRITIRLLSKVSPFHARQAMKPFFFPGEMNFVFERGL